MVPRIMIQINLFSYVGMEGLHNLWSMKHRLRPTGVKQKETEQASREHGKELVGVSIFRICSTW